MKVSVVHTGARDQYQVAAAFAEVDQLDRLVTSGYSRHRGLVRHLIDYSNRRNTAIPDAAVDSVIAVDVAKRLGRLLGQEQQFSMWAEIALARYAAIRTSRSDAIVAYNYLAGMVFPHFAGRKVLFQCHPNPIALQGDVFAGVDLSKTGFAIEREIAWGDLYRKGLESEWRLADSIIVASSFVRQSLVLAGADPALISVVPYGCDEPKRAETRRLSPKGKRKLLFVGQLVWRKGADLLAPVLCALGQPFELDVVTRGLCDTHILNNLAGAPGVTIHRDIPRSRLDALYAGAHALIFPSRFEGYGLVINEALSYGLPVIATENTALPDILAKQPVGCCLTELTICKLTEQIRALFEESVYATATRAAHDYARDHPWSAFRRGVRDMVGRIP